MTSKILFFPILFFRGTDIAAVDIRERIFGNRFLQLFITDMRIDLRGAELRVTEDLLERKNINSGNIRSAKKEDGEE